MAPNIEDECPICLASLSTVTDGNSESKESHIKTCIEAHSSNSKPIDPKHLASPAQPQGNEEDTCAICHTSFLTKNFQNNASAREAHFSTCFDSQISTPSQPVSPPSYKRAETFATMATYEKEKGMPTRSARPDAALESGLGPIRSPTMPVQLQREHKNVNVGNILIVS